MKDFIQQALRTEAPVKPEVIERYQNHHKVLSEMLVELNSFGWTIDVLKKEIFYNKRSNDSDPMPPGPPEKPFGAEEKQRLNSCIRDMHGVMGKLTELGELAERYLKYIFYNEPLDVTNIMEEIADGWWYDAVICDQRGISWEQPQERVIAKLRQRYPEKFTEYDAQNRDLQKERQALTGFVSDEDTKKPLDLLEIAWAVISNAYGGNWGCATHEWLHEACRFRDIYFELIGKNPYDATVEIVGIKESEKEGGRTAREKATNQSNTAQPGESIQNTVQKVKDLTTEVQALRRFKRYVHLYLDKIGIPEMSNSQPCRIGVRLDYLMVEDGRNIPTIDPKEYE